MSRSRSKRDSISGNEADTKGRERDVPCAKTAAAARKGVSPRENASAAPPSRRCSRRHCRYCTFAKRHSFRRELGSSGSFGRLYHGKSGKPDVAAIGSNRRVVVTTAVTVSWRKLPTVTYL